MTVTSAASLPVLAPYVRSGLAGAEVERRYAWGLELLREIPSPLEVAQVAQQILRTQVTEALADVDVLLSPTMPTTAPMLEGYASPEHLADPAGRAVHRLLDRGREPGRAARALAAERPLVRRRDAGGDDADEPAAHRPRAAAGRGGAQGGGRRRLRADARRAGRGRVVVRPRPALPFARGDCYPTVTFPHLGRWKRWGCVKLGMPHII